MLKQITILIILCALTVTAWGQGTWVENNGETRFVDSLGQDIPITIWSGESSLRFEELIISYPSGRTYQLVEDSVAIYDSTHQFVKDSVFLDWRQVEEEPDTEIEITLTNVAKWDARLPDIEILDTIDYISDTVIDSVIFTDCPCDDCDILCIHDIQFRIRCREEVGEIVLVDTYGYEYAPNQDLTEDMAGIGNYIDPPVYRKRFYEIIVKCCTTKVK